MGEKGTDTDSWGFIGLHQFYDCLSCATCLENWLLVVDQRTPQEFGARHVKSSLSFHDSLHRTDGDKAYRLWKATQRIACTDKCEEDCRGPCRRASVGRIVLIPPTSSSNNVERKRNDMQNIKAFVQFVKGTPGLSSDVQVFVYTDSIAELYKAYPFVCCSSSESESSPDLERYESWPTRILPHLFLGDYSSATAAPVLRRWGITHIINVTHEPNYFQCNNTSPRTSSSYPSSPLATHSSVARSSASSNSSSRQDAPGASKDSFQYLRIAVSDSSKQSIAEYFETAISFIEEARKESSAVLVHCIAGISRSTTIVLAYLMKTEGWSLDKAYRFVKEKRHIIEPNRGFMQQLALYEQTLFASEEEC
ncbi:Dual specificity protein phosphatase 15 [Balamuthia mandrillaris]